MREEPLNSASSQSSLLFATESGGLVRQLAPTELALRLETVNKCLKEGNNFIFLRVCLAKLTDRLVYVIPVLGHGPTCHLFNRSRGALSGLYGESVHIARVIEVDDLLQGRQIAVMHERLDETGIRHSGRITRSSRLELA